MSERKKRKNKEKFPCRKKAESRMKPSTWQSKQTGDLRADPFWSGQRKIAIEPAKTDKIANQSA